MNVNAVDTDAIEDEAIEADLTAPRWPWIIGTSLSLLGLAASAYLTYEHYTGSKTLACPAGGQGSIINCAKVTTSPWSVEFGLPVAVLGLVFFALMIVFQSPWAWRSLWRPLRAARVGWCLVGLGNAIVLLYDELAKIDAICEWCTSVHVLTLLLFVTTIFGTISTAPALEE